MPRDESGVKWAGWPLAGALGAGRHDELAPSPDSFGLTPSAQDEQERFEAARAVNAAQIAELFDVQEGSDAGPEQSG